MYISPVFSCRVTYVDGVSITYDTLRKHTWTYAIGLYSEATNEHSSNCPCSGTLPLDFAHNYYSYIANLSVCYILPIQWFTLIILCRMVMAVPMF